MPPRKAGPGALRPARAVRRRTVEDGDSPASMIEATVEIEEVQLASFNPATNILIHGPSGHGKTVLAGGAYASSYVDNIVFLSTELEGAVSAKVTGSQARLWPAPTWEHAVAGVRKAVNELGDRDWLVCDSGTKMQELYMRWILAKVNAKNPHRDLDIPDVREHQKYQNGFKRWYDTIINARFNSIFITQSMTVEDAEGESRVIPLLLGKKGEISDYCSGQAGVGIYYSVSRESREEEATGDAIIRRALFQPYPPWWAKDRYDALGFSRDVESGDYTAMARMIDDIERVKEKSRRTSQSRRTVRRVAR